MAPKIDYVLWFLASRTNKKQGKIMPMGFQWP